MATEAMSLDDLKARYEGDLTTRFTDRFLTIKLEEAIAFIEGKCPTAADRLESGALSKTDYWRIISEVTFRKLRNPGGYASEGEGGVSYSLRADVASGTFLLTDSDIETLTGRSPRSTNMLPGTVGMGVDVGWGS